MLGLDIKHLDVQNVQEQFKIKYAVKLCFTEFLEHSIDIIIFCFAKDLLSDMEG